MKDNKLLISHLCMLAACIFWGLMSPLGKDAMTHGISGVDMVSFRVAGAALLFWALSLFTPKERLSPREILIFIPAAIFGIVLNQCGFTIGLSITSPGNASIVTTTLPIFAMIMAFLILHEPITWKKAGGVLLGCAGAVMLVLMSAASSDSRVGNIKGDLIVMGAQVSYAFFLSTFNPIVKKYSVVTVNKWMFLFAALMIWPFTVGHVSRIEWAAVPARAYLETAYVVVVGTFISYILLINAQKSLRPTVVAVYNYVQPIVALTVSVLTGLGVFSPLQGVSIVLIFLGVMLVNKSRAKGEAKSLKQGQPEK